MPPESKEVVQQITKYFEQKLGQTMLENYSDQHIQSLSWHEHIRLRPGMYIGKLGDGSSPDDGIYILLKEIIDNSIDEFVMGCGDRIEVNLTETQITVRDFGRGIPLNKLYECVAQINTGAKYDSRAFKKSVGLNGVGTKAVNALSNRFVVESFRSGQERRLEFSKGLLKTDSEIKISSEQQGTRFEFVPDPQIFASYHFEKNFICNLLQNYSFLNPGLLLRFNDEAFISKRGLVDLLDKHLDGATSIYPVMHLKKPDLEIALTHVENFGETYFSFVNGQFTPMGGTHQAAFKEGFVRSIKEHYQKDFVPEDIRNDLVAVISVRIEEPIFESQTKTKLGSTQTAPRGGESLKSWMTDFLKEQIDNELLRNKSTAEGLKQKILRSEKERLDFGQIKKISTERTKKANLYNKKLRDCRVERNSQHARRLETTLFITEGDSASGSLTKVRDVQTQAVFSLRGKPMNTFGMTKKVLYENEEFNLLMHAMGLDQSNSIDDLRYNRIVIATDADVDGMHIRLLMVSFFLQFYPEIVREGHLYILETPLFRVRAKDKTIYCYNEPERDDAQSKLGAKSEITRFKGLGEISPDEFRFFIGTNMKLQQVTPSMNLCERELLSYYMGKNTAKRQDNIMTHLKTDLD